MSLKIAKKKIKIVHLRSLFAISIALFMAQFTQKKVSFYIYIEKWRGFSKLIKKKKIQHWLMVMADDQDNSDSYRQFIVEIRKKVVIN